VGTSGDGDGDGLDDCKTGEECSDEEFQAPELDADVKDFATSTKDFFTSVQQAPLVQQVQGISVPDGGSCSFPSASTSIGEINVDFICDHSNWLNDLYPVFLAIWALAAVRVLMSA
jgi:hypothetical protein